MKYSDTPYIRLYKPEESTLPWVNVDDHLPETNTRVLIYVLSVLHPELDDFLVAILQSPKPGEKHFNSCWYIPEANEVVDEALLKVSHWTQLPEKPKVGK